MTGIFLDDKNLQNLKVEMRREFSCLDAKRDILSASLHEMLDSIEKRLG